MRRTGATALIAVALGVALVGVVLAAAVFITLKLCRLLSTIARIGRARVYHAVEIPIKQSWLVVVESAFSSLLGSLVKSAKSGVACGRPSVFAAAAYASAAAAGDVIDVVA